MLDPLMHNVAQDGTGYIRRTQKSLGYMSELQTSLGL